MRAEARPKKTRKPTPKAQVGERRTVFVAPFLGEFGWEVCMWVPWLRGVVGTATVKLFCKPTHQWLYRHVTSDVNDIDFQLVLDVESVDCQHAWTQAGRIDRAGYRKLLGKDVPKDARVITPCDLTYTWPGNSCPKPVGAVHGDRLPREPRRKHIALHVRACTGKQPERNWTPSSAQAVANALIDAGWTVYAIGARNDAHCPVGVTDARSIGLAALSGIVRGCEFVVGPSSGPMHFANHCGVPVLWWSGNAKDQPRYARVWNPWGLPNRQVAASWNPSPSEILTAIREATSSPVSVAPGLDGSPAA